MNHRDFLVIGGGIIGIAVAQELKKRHADASVTVLEKEERCGLHASGRNSGVLHAGFYYSADSLKARFTRSGNQRLTQYCKEKQLNINECGKLVVARNESELPWLDELLNRAKNNGVELKLISEQEARDIEPKARTFEKALFSPSTSSVDPVEVLLSLKDDAVRSGVEIISSARYLGREASGIKTTQGSFQCNYLVNAAGLYADTIGLDFGFSKNYRILPFKGLYLYSSQEPGSLRTNIYPVPDLRNPFLGVHFTVTSAGHVKIGPTAIPAFWREQYDGLKNFKLNEMMEIAIRQLGLFFHSNFDFKKLAYEEIRKYSRSCLVSLASELLEGVRLSDYSKWGKPGIRAQLLNIKEKKLEMDFVLEGDDNSMHILNAVSPGFTCALPFAEYVCDRIKENTGF
ncbi:MAG: L-2-hydroxyglutarate oxidase [Candidatus Nitrohelix vancouverensis]|uniref:L-2-hydroxyglutarate oxidase n=1 Tax=Candidatus Nitrohelix vancouverensis TaxID=2705534 RepID=A0A7T0C2G3_9BACT|nr:MAG: L-2-hydroxyglutarate oxidase [Candidatus Nitrohelix vancouverensis]